MLAVQLVEYNGQAATQIIESDAGAYHFCRNCKEDDTCDHSHGKITPRSSYVLRYLYEFDAGVNIYPLPGSWELQPHWFMSMFTAGRSEMIRIRNEKQQAEITKARTRI